MHRELPFQTLGDVARHGLELHVYCPSCYASRVVAADDTRWCERLFATARFRCTGQRHIGRPCAGAGVPTIRPRLSGHHAPLADGLLAPLGVYRDPLPIPGACRCSKCLRIRGSAFAAHAFRAELPPAAA